MPDKSKRRKNKNKKNKNKKNRTENATSTKSSINNDESISSSCENIDLNSSIIDDAQNENKTQIVSDGNIRSDILETDQPSTSVTDDQNLIDQTILNQDLNNNNDKAPVGISCAPNDDLMPSDSENISQSYIVESPEQSTISKPKLINTIKSKSLDDDDAPNIEEITGETSIAQGDDDTLAVIDSSNVTVSDVESDVDWEKIDELSDGKDMKNAEKVTGTVSITAIPLNFAQCDLTQSLTPEEEISLRQYLRTLNLTTQPEQDNVVSKLEIRTEIEKIVDQEIKHRLRKKASTEEFLPTHLGPPRILDVIDEEGSSESSMSSRRHSHLSEKKVEVDDLDDDVFEDSKKIVAKSSSKFIGNRNVYNLQRSLPQPCLLVGAKMKDPDVNEARVDWSMQTVEKITGAEVVYLTDTSSSTSSICDAVSDVDDEIDNESSVRMITPTIEVTDTESLLKKTFLTKSNEEPTKVNKNSQVNINEKLDDSNKDVTSNTIHEVVVTSIDNIKTDLYVKDIDESNEIKPIKTDISKLSDSSKDKCAQDSEIKILKTELNEAFNTLMREVSSDTESSDKVPPFVRQDSSSSSVASQCTAKYNPTCSSLNDITNITHDEHDSNKSQQDALDDATSHVKDVFECIAGTSRDRSRITDHFEEPSALRDICLKKIASLPYGDKIIEELAAVSKRLYHANILNKVSTSVIKRTDIEKVKERKLSGDMPYFPLPDISTINQVILPSHDKEPVPPPVKPRYSSLKKSQDDTNWTALPTKTAPVYLCLSPSQKMLMERTNTVISKEDASELVDSHKKFVDRRGYNESYSKESERSTPQANEPPVIPFKSQTGSRLLALIRDPSVTNNIKPSPSSNSKFSQLRKNFESLEKSSDHTFRSLKEFSSTMKPIPPPRAKKFSSSYYESDESSEFTDSSLRSIKSEKKFFHYSTGQLNKDIESDVSSIQNMHRYNYSGRDLPAFMEKPRRPSLPKDICDEQMEYIRQKEKEVEAEIQRLEKQRTAFLEKRQALDPTMAKSSSIVESKTENNNFTSSFSKEVSKSSNLEKNKFSSSQEELNRDKMYSEYVSQMAARQERKEKKIIKITNTPVTANSKVSKSTSSLDIIDSKVNNPIEKEFIYKARERWNKLGIHDPETEDERDSGTLVYREPKPKIIEHKIKVIEGGEEKDVKRLPSHLQDFVRFTTKDKDKDPGSDTSGESRAAPPAPHVIVCAVIILVIAIGKYFLRFWRNNF